MLSEEQVRSLPTDDLTIAAEAEEVAAAHQQVQVALHEVLELGHLAPLKMKVLTLHHLVVIELESLTITQCTFASSLSGDFVLESKFTVTTYALYPSDNSL
jgi:uncharacterized protein with von Willebrand factor type A (vWA) domain